MKKLKVICKVFFAGLIAVIILSIVLCVYRKTAVHIENELGNTDYVWTPNSHWFKVTEGISWGQVDAAGFNNVSVVTEPDIIVLGSSHMEGTNVMQNENAAYLLNKKLENKYSVYNMGISGHTLKKVCQYLPNSLELYSQAPKVTIIETSNVNISQTDVDEVMNRTVEFTPSNSTGMIGLLQKIPFFRTLYFQIADGLLDLFMPNNVAEDNDKTQELQIENESPSADLAAYNELFSYLEDLEQQYDTEIIIFYHSTETIMEDGSIEFPSDCYLEAFDQAAEKYGITFIDMAQAFEEMYYSEHHTAHGFVTGRLGTGHLNAYGHAAVADELYSAITKLEEEN